MSNNGKVKVYKNPQRNEAITYKPYVPQYQQLGLSPEEYKSAIPSGHQLPKPAPGSRDNPRVPRPLIRPQPYAEAVASPIGRGRGPIPNVGNNMEQTWSSVDNEIVDDISGIDEQAPVIDNNDFVSAAALGLPDDSLIEVEEMGSDAIDNLRKATWEIEQSSNKTFLTENELQDALREEFTSSVIKQLGNEDYLLMANGVAICSGTLEHVQEKTRDLVFQEVDDIVVLKRVKIKVGVFLE
jgi:hypothetical protein